MRNRVATLPGKYELCLILSETAVSPVEMDNELLIVTPKMFLQLCDKSNCYNLGCRILTAIDAINVLSMGCDQDCFHWKGIAGNVLANLRNITTNIVGDAVKNVFLFVIEAYSFKTVQFCFFSLFCFMCSRGKLQTPNINSSCLCQPACPTVRKNSTTAGKFS